MQHTLYHAPLTLSLLPVITYLRFALSGLFRTRCLIASTCLQVASARRSARSKRHSPSRRAASCMQPLDGRDPHQTTAALQHGARLGWCGEFCKRWQSGMTRGYPIRGRDHDTSVAAGAVLTALRGVVPAPILYARTFHTLYHSSADGWRLSPWRVVMCVGAPSQALGSVVHFTSSVVTSGTGFHAACRQVFVRLLGLNRWLLTYPLSILAVARCSRGIITFIG